MRAINRGNKMWNACRCVVLSSLALWLAVLAQPVLAQPQVDLPACELSAPASGAGLSVGIVQPYASAALVNYAVRQTQVHGELNVCAASWREVLPRWVPWSPALERGLGFAVFVAAFVAAVTLLWFITPRAWWRRTSLLGVLGVAGLTWGLAVGALVSLQALGVQRVLYDTVVSLRVPGEVGTEWVNLKDARDLEALLAGRHLLGKPAADSATVRVDAPVQPATLEPSGVYRVVHRLNLRSGPGTQTEWLTTLPRGEVVRFDGAVQGDWWRLRSARGDVGWASSLWLRRMEEGLPPADSAGVAPRS